jgi:hypothetical protein
MRQDGLLLIARLVSQPPTPWAEPQPVIGDNVSGLRWFEHGVLDHQTGIKVPAALFSYQSLPMSRCLLLVPFFHFACVVHSFGGELRKQPSKIIVLRTTSAVRHLLHPFGAQSDAVNIAQVWHLQLLCLFRQLGKNPASQTGSCALVRIFNLYELLRNWITDDQ